MKPARVALTKKWVSWFSSGIDESIGNNAPPFSIQFGYQQIYGSKAPSVSAKSDVIASRRAWREFQRLRGSSSRPSLVPANNSTADTNNMSSSTATQGQSNSHPDTTAPIRPVPRHTEGLEGGHLRPRGANWSTRVTPSEVMEWVRTAPVTSIFEQMKASLLEKRTISVFLSSPFDGLELERKIFQEKYAPELFDLCAKKGYVLKLCDMRFGITSDMTQSHQTVITCMRSIDQADIFLGFFGSRYGSSTLMREVVAMLEVTESSRTITQSTDGSPSMDTTEIKFKEVSDPGKQVNNVELPTIVAGKAVGPSSRDNRYFIRIGNDSRDVNMGTDIDFKEFLVISCDPGSHIMVIAGKIDDLSLFTKGSRVLLVESVSDWILKDIELAEESFPFLKDMTERSVTDMEFEYAFFHENAHRVLNQGVLPQPEGLSNIIQSGIDAINNIIGSVSECREVHLVRPSDQLLVGMNIAFKDANNASVSPKQTITQWNSEDHKLKFLPGLSPLFAPTPGTSSYEVTVPKRLCVAMFRAPTYDQSLHDQADTDKERRRYRVENARSDNALKELKSRWSKLAEVDNCAMLHDYSTPEEAARCMYLTLKAALPKLMTSSRVEYTQFDVQKNFLRSRLIRELPLIGRDEQMSDAMDRVRLWMSGSAAVGESHAPRAGLSLTVTGAPGVGISAMIAHLCDQISNEPKFKDPIASVGTVVFHFAGCNLVAGETGAMVESIVDQFKRYWSDYGKFNLSEEDQLIEAGLSTHKKLSWIFDRVRHLTEHYYVLAIDGLHQLINDYYDGTSFLAHQLKWLPTPDLIPPNVCLILGAEQTSSCFSLLQERIDASPQNCLTLTLPLLEPPDIETFIKNNLAYNYKNMDDAWLSMTLKPSCAYPAYLQLAVNEIITTATFSTLAKKISALERLTDVTSLAQSIFERIEETLNCIDGSKTTFVEDCLSLLWCSRKGLTESEIVELCNIKFQYSDKLAVKVNQLHWLMLFFGLHNLLVECGELYSLASPCVRQAVEAKYILQGRSRDDTDVQAKCDALHRRLAAYFKMKADHVNCNRIDAVPREIQEMDYHYQAARVTPPVRVAVRVRPFMPFELQSEGKELRSFVKMKGKQTIVQNPATSNVHVFTLDHAFWSCYNDPELTAPSSRMGGAPKLKVATNENLWKLLGSSVVQQAIGSFDVSLFAYGQTGSGKTHTMFGSNDGKDPGVIYLTCSELFRQLQANKQHRNINFYVYVSMLEIYNETVRDLLAVSPTPPGSVDASAMPSLLSPVRHVREDAEGKVHIKDLTFTPVSTWEQVSQVIAKAYSLRAVSGTRMNAQSSRSHCIFTLHLIQNLADNPNCEFRSKIHLVDLAGSESGKTREAVDPKNAKRVHLEGVFINKSLSALNKCIRALADRSRVMADQAHSIQEANSSNKDPTSKDDPMIERPLTGSVAIASNDPSLVNIHVPYRESKLTHILKESLGGRSKLILLATVSPCKDSYPETLSTLNYAKKAKKIESSEIQNAESQFAQEILKRMGDHILLVSADKLKFAVPKSAANRTRSGSVMLVQQMATNPHLSAHNAEIIIPRAIGRVLELAAEFLREHIVLSNASSGDVENWNAAFTERVEDKLCLDDQQCLPWLMNGLIISYDLEIEDLILIFAGLLTKYIARSPFNQLEEKCVRQIGNGLTTEQRLQRSQQRIDAYKNKKIRISGRRSSLHRDGDFLKAGYQPFEWIVVPVSPGKCAFMTPDGYFMTAYGALKDYQDFIQGEIKRIAMSISSDIVTDLVATVTQKDKQMGDTFNYACVRVEKGALNRDSPTPCVNQLFEIHDGAGRSTMITTFCGTCLRSPDWSSDVMYSLYAVGTALGDEQFHISAY